MRILNILTRALALGALPLAAAAQQATTLSQVLDKIVTQEQVEMQSLRQYSPLVETYIQILRPDKHLGSVPDGDKYFLGRAELAKGVELEPLTRGSGTKHNKIFGGLGSFFSMEFLPQGFLQMIYLDMYGFDRQHYNFEFVRREFLGEVRCLVFDVDPIRKNDKGRFVGRIWVEDQELNKTLVEAPVNDEAEAANDYSPVQAERSWGRQAENNVVDSMERLGLMALYGDVDRVLETVVNNLEVTNGLDIQPEVRCRVLMISTLESFTIGHTIVLSRGLVDVLPDEASLATILAHELGHVVLGHRMDSQFAFFNRVRFDEKETFRHFGFARTPEEEQAANQKGMELLRNSPYKDQSGTARLFLQALKERSKAIPNLISPHLGNRVQASWTVLSAVFSAQTSDEKPAANVIAALPLGGRIKIEPWNDHLQMLKSSPVGTVAESEKMQFEVTPFVLYLTRQGDHSLAEVPEAISASSDSDPKP